MRPIFVGGCPRSGTTMLGAMLGAGRDVACPPEMEFKTALLRAGASGPLAPERTRALLAADVKADVQGWRFGEGAIPPGPCAVDELLRAIVRAHVGVEPGWWVDHTPTNLRWAPSLLRAFPDARFVHVVRDGRAVAASLKLIEWGPNSAARAAHYWLEQLSAGLAAETALGDRCVRVRFEDLVTDAEAHLRSLCDHLGLEYEPAMAAGGGFTPAAYSQGQHRRVGKPPDPAAATAWRESLTAREVEIFEAVVSEQLELLGYESRFGLQAVPATGRERWVTEAQDLLRRRVTNSIRSRRRFRASGRRR